MGPKSWYVEMVIYRPASFVSMQVSWKYKQIIKYGRQLPTYWFVDKNVFVNVILLPKFEILFSDKSEISGL